MPESSQQIETLIVKRLATKRPRKSRKCLQKMLIGVFVVLAATFQAGLCSSPAQEYNVGGPLAGVKLPLFPTQHGEPAGHPGAIPKTQFAGTDKLAPQWDLYSGSVEQWRAYMFKYMPIRSSFDRQSQIENWVAPEIPGAEQQHIEAYASPVYKGLRHSPSINTGRKYKPVPVVRCKVGDTVFKTDLGELGVGIYVVRVIGAVETKAIKNFRKSLFLRASINDGLNGEVSTHRIRLGYCDEFYDVADVYFHALVKRRYTIELTVDTGSDVELLVHNVSLDDVLAGTVRRPIKTTSVHGGDPNIQPKPSQYSPEKRLERDAMIWNGFPPLNYQRGGFGKGYGSVPGVLPGTDTLSREEIISQYGNWECSKDLNKFLVNKKLNLEYSLDDLRNNRPLPDPYPFKDDGAGLVYSDPSNPNTGKAWCPVGRGVGRRMSALQGGFGKGAQPWVKTRNQDAAHDAAMYLIRFAYAFPSLEDGNMLNSVVHEEGAHGRGYRCRRRETSGGAAIGHFAFQFQLAKNYDQLFDYIDGDEELATSVSRFIPSIKTSKDVIEFLDVYLIQILAKRFMRYQYFGDGREPAIIAEVAAVLGDNSVTDPWMEWVFSKVFYYPRPLSGLPDYSISATDRDGRSTIGSSSYVIGDSSAAALAEALEGYVMHGGNPKYDLRDRKRYPKSIAALDFIIRMRTAGMWFMRMGNVCGPDKGWTKGFESLMGHDTLTGWRWTKDPRYAYIISNYVGKGDRSDADWAEIEGAAAKVKRAPWMDNRSRILSNYAAFLETGLEHDDYRFRRSVVLRIGTGHGHAHYDSLDMQIHAHGLPMTIDAGQRPGYSKPADACTRVHNTVEIDGNNWQAGHVGGVNSWVRNLSDFEGARYLCAQIAPTRQAKLARRQVALIDVDEGSGSETLGPKAWGKRPAGLPKDIVTPNSYVFDVFRVSGGSAHTYCFHSQVNDPTGKQQPRLNVDDIVPLDDAGPTERSATAAAYLKSFSGERYYGTAPKNFEAVFSLQKKREHPGKIVQAGAESRFLGQLFDAESPDKFTKLHLLGVENALVMKGDLHCTRWEYFIPNIFVQRRGKNLESAFAAIIEPYAGEPFINSTERLNIPGNELDALRAVAVLVKTKNGHTDTLFADGRPDKVRHIGDLTVSAEFAFHSTDGDGLRQAALTGGRELTGPDIRIKVGAAERTGTIVKADYHAKTVWIDEKWPKDAEGGLVEIKTQPLANQQAYVSGYTATSVNPEKDGTAIVFLRSADIYRAQIKSIDKAKGIVKGSLPLSLTSSGYQRGWTASNDTLTHFWRVKSIGHGFALEGAPVAAEAFAPENALRLWEYGIGDRISQKTSVSVRRLKKHVYELTGDTDAEISFPTGQIEMSTDRAVWTASGKTADPGWMNISIRETQFSEGPVFLRTQ